MKKPILEKQHRSTVPVIFSWLLAFLFISFEASAQVSCPDPGGGFEFIYLDSQSSPNNFYPGTLPSGRSGTEKSTVGYVTLTTSRSPVYPSRSITIFPELANGAQGSVVLKFDKVDIGVDDATISIYYADNAAGTPNISINKDNESSFTGTTVVHDGPVTIQFSKTTAGGAGDFDIYIKYLTGDQVITSCQGQQVAVWTDFMQPNSYTFIDDYGDAYGGNSAPICVGYFDGSRKFVSSEVSICLDHDRHVASVAFWYYPGEVVYTLDANPNHDIDRSGTYDGDDQLKMARILWMLANAPLALKPDQLAAQKAVWATLDNPATFAHASGSLALQAQQAVPVLPVPAEPTFSVSADGPAAPGSPVNFALNFNITGGHPSRVKLSVPAGLVIGAVTGNGTYDPLTGIVTFTSLPATVNIPVTSTSVRQAAVTVIYEETDFWNISNLQVYNSCNSLVQDFIGLGRRDIVNPYREATGIWDSSMPVSLVDFAVAAEGSLVNLKWGTTREENNSGFEVQRSSDAKTWQKIGFVSAKSVNGNSVVQLGYSFNDASPRKGINYYRLKISDFDGTFSHSPMRAIQLGKSERDLLVYPNPSTNGKLMVDIAAGGRYQVEVHNLAGARVLQCTIGGSKELSVDDLPAGLYLLSVKSEGGDTQTKRFLVK